MHKSLQQPAGFVQEAVPMQAKDEKPSSGAAVAAAIDDDNGDAGSPSVSEASATGLKLASMKWLD